MASLKSANEPIAQDPAECPARPRSQKQTGSISGVFLTHRCWVGGWVLSHPTAQWPQTQRCLLLCHRSLPPVACVRVRFCVYVLMCVHVCVHGSGELFNKSYHKFTKVLCHRNPEVNPLEKERLFWPSSYAQPTFSAVRLSGCAHFYDKAVKSTWTLVLEYEDENAGSST